MPAHFMSRTEAPLTRRPGPAFFDFHAPTRRSTHAQVFRWYGLASCFYGPALVEMMREFMLYHDI